MHSTIEPGFSCPRYFGSALGAASTGGISIRWRDGYSFSVEVGDGVDLSWDLTLAATPVTRLMSAVSGRVPERLWRSRTFLRVVGAVAGPALGAGHLGLTGKVPNGQSFGRARGGCGVSAKAPHASRGTAWATLRPFLSKTGSATSGSRSAASS